MTRRHFTLPPIREKSQKEPPITLRTAPAGGLPYPIQRRLEFFGKEVHVLGEAYHLSD